MNRGIAGGVILSAVVFVAAFAQHASSATRNSSPQDTFTHASTSANNRLNTFGHAAFPTEFGIARRLHLRKLPPTVASHATPLANGNIVAAGDAGVSAAVLADSATIIDQVATPLIQNHVGAVPKDTRVVLYSKRKSYADALRRAGIPSDQVTQIVKETGGITVGSDVWIPLYASNSDADLSNVLTHELTHVVFNEEGIGDSLPTWINEGTAWSDGLAAESAQDSSRVRDLAQSFNQQLKSAQNLLPLSASEQDILSASYNVEWEDYLAVQQLTKSFGAAKYESFLRQASAIGVQASFQSAFGTSLQQYEGQFYQSLKQGQIASS